MMLGFRQLLNSIEAARAGTDSPNNIHMMPAMVYSMEVNRICRPGRVDCSGRRNGRHDSFLRFCHGAGPDDSTEALLLPRLLLLVVIIVVVDGDAIMPARLAQQPCAAATSATSSPSSCFSKAVAASRSVEWRVGSGITTGSIMTFGRVEARKGRIAMEQNVRLPLLSRRSFSAVTASTSDFLVTRPWSRRYTTPVWRTVQIPSQLLPIS